MYAFETDENNNLKTITRTSDGVRIKEDQESQDYCDCLSWLSSSQEPRLLNNYNFDSTGHFFDNEIRLVEHCKEQGLILYTAIKTRNQNPRIVISELRKWSGKQFTFHRLERAVALPGATGQVAPGGVVGESSDVWVSLALYSKIVDKLPDEMADIRRLSSWPIKRSFVYLDVSDFSKFPAGQQALVINSIVRLVKDDRCWVGPHSKFARAGLESQICIGDGYIFVFKQPTNATYFASYLAYLIEHLCARELTRIIPIEFHFRIGVHVDPVYCFYDPGRRDWNYIGDGINGGQRVLAAAGKEKDDVVYVSDKVRKAIAGEREEGSPNAELLANMNNRGRHMDKHHNMWRLYEMNHTDLFSNEFSLYVIE